MTTPLVYITPETTIEESMAIMTDRRIRHLPVVESDEVIGVVSIGDLVKFQTQEQSFQIKYLTEYISGVTYMIGDVMISPTSVSWLVRPKTAIFRR